MSELREALDVLTPKQLEVVFQVACGCSNREIAQRLCISVSAVKRRIRNAKNKLEVEKRSDLTMWLVDQSLITESAALWAVIAGPLELSNLLEK